MVLTTLRLNYRRVADSVVAQDNFITKKNIFASLITFVFRVVRLQEQCGKRSGEQR